MSSATRANNTFSKRIGSSGGKEPRISEVYGMPCGDKNPSFRRCLCHKPRDHHGPHWDDCGATWPNLAEMTPCTSSEMAVLGVMGDPARVRCGKLEGHDGDHIFVMTWSGRFTY